MATETQKVLAGMLIEPTGRNICDSGGAYGRNWEMNRDKTVQSFIDSPKVETSEFGPTISIFHYCDSWLEFDAELDTKFNEWVDAKGDENSPWRVEMEEFAGEHAESWLGGTVNSYNSENLLSQVIQYTHFEGIEDGEQYILLQIHGGCDVRGGYTKPRVFRVLEEGFGWDADAFTIATCDDRKGERVTIDYRAGELMHVEYENAWPRETFTGTEINCEDWTDFWCYEGKSKWDDEAKKFICPDGDGHFCFDSSLY